MGFGYSPKHRKETHLLILGVIKENVLYIGSHLAPLGVISYLSKVLAPQLLQNPS